MDFAEHITEGPAVQGGRPVLKGTRVAVQIVVGSLAGGMTVEEVCEQYRVTEQQVRSALQYAAEAVADRRIVALRGGIRTLDMPHRERRRRHGQCCTLAQARWTCPSPTPVRLA